MVRHKGAMKNIRALKLDEEGFKDEQRILRDLKNALHEEFGFCLWDKMMREKQMDLEELYDYYCKEQMREKVWMFNIFLYICNDDLTY